MIIIIISRSVVAMHLCVCYASSHHALSHTLFLTFSPKWTRQLTAYLNAGSSQGFYLKLGFSSPLLPVGYCALR